MSAGITTGGLRVLHGAVDEVDPALVIHYSGTEEKLFLTVTGLPAGLPDLFASLIEQYLR